MIIRTYLSGAAIEIFCVGWVHFSERNKPLQTAICSMLIAVAQVTGIGEAITNYPDAIAFVLGYGSGTFGMVMLKKHKSKFL